MTGRLIDLPLQGDYGEAESKAAGPVPDNTGLAGLNKLGYAGSLSLGSWVPDVMAHGSGTPPPLPATAARARRVGKTGSSADHCYRETDAPAGSDGKFEEARRVHQQSIGSEVRKNLAWSLSSANQYDTRRERRIRSAGTRAPRGWAGSCIRTPGPHGARTNRPRDLFAVRVMQVRHRLGLPLIETEKVDLEGDSSSVRTAFPDAARDRRAIPGRR